jgi:2-polyprenyl-3-methyl-5-hydroxy-6-metoxy-1,4-benzoquinol methylase
MNKTLNYYATNAREFVTATLGVDVTALQDRFLQHLPTKARILDAGCGSGRDALAFSNKGHTVRAFDAVPELVTLAQAHTGLRVELGTFQTLTDENFYDGIWACASLLHVPLAEMQDVFSRLAKALAARGILYASFKVGEGENERNGRMFTCFSEASFREFVEAEGSFGFEEVWISTDARPGREDEFWLNAILRKR